jgi:hypothetical protein
MLCVLYCPVRTSTVQASSESVICTISRCVLPKTVYIRGFSRFGSVRFFWTECQVEREPLSFMSTTVASLPWTESKARRVPKTELRKNIFSVFMHPQTAQRRLRIKQN